MSSIVAASLGLVVAGPLGAAIGASLPLMWARAKNRPQPDPPVRLVLLLLLVGLRSGLSVLASLIETSQALPRYGALRSVARVARVTGLTESLSHADEALGPVLAQLARAQRSGASLSGAVRRMLDGELAAERARRIARARALPVKLMLPVTLLMLPGLVLLLYGPSLLGMFSELTGVLG
ncbi:MAG TPA: type II secretion system F family protein [Acidimicrobiia bacterium]|nr:type II secretion system F family protein [Acidimicrobiia bacterium]